MSGPTTEPAPKAESSGPSKPTKPGIGEAVARLFRKNPNEDPLDADVIVRRRRFVAAAVLGSLTVNLLMFLRFFFPRVLFEPKTKFKIGYPSDFGFGVDTKYQKDYRIWVVRNVEGLFTIFARCTHLGCTPDWIASENKFKCPCHGSGYYKDGVNFEGPAPRPMDRVRITKSEDGQLVVDVSVKYIYGTWDKPGAFLKA